MTNPYLGPAILDALERGLAPKAAIATALAGDEGAGIRQVHCVDAQGRTAAWTGVNCVEWAGDMALKGFSVAGNMLSNERVVAETARVFGAESRLALPERLLAALDAGEAAGGDKRGRQSAGMVVTTTEDFPDINIRVDDHQAPLTEMRRLLELWRKTVEPRRPWFPSRANPSGNTDLDAMEKAWTAAGLALRFRR